MQSSSSGEPSGSLSQLLASFAKDTQWEDIPQTIRHEAKRSLLNFFATSLGGCREDAIDITLSVLARYSGEQSCAIIGRHERADMLLAAYVNAMSANIFDYDDTHPATIIHPTAPIAPALFAYAQDNDCDGRALLRAFILGGEIECRIGNAVSPSHYARGWHITSTCGVFGAAAAIGTLLGLSEEQYVWAFGNASAQAGGMVETLGTMSKSISVGNAARNGITSSLLAAEGFFGPADPLDGTRGFLPVYSDLPKPEALSEGLGEVWEIGKNTYKPYPVGVVLNPVVEACIKLHREKTCAIEDVTGVELRGHPLLRQRTDRPHVSTGRESQVCAQHAIAISLRRGQAGLAEFNDGAVAETLRDKIRPEINFIDDDSYDIEAVRMVVSTRQGKDHIVEIAAAQGGSNNPMSDRDLEQKLERLAKYGGFERDVEPIAEAIWSLDSARDASEVMGLATPSG